MKAGVKRLIFFASLFIIWEVAVLLIGWSPAVMPKPSNVAVALYQGFTDKTLVYDLAASFKRLGIGLFLALNIGTLLGIWLAKSKTADETVGTLVLALQSVPSIVWLPLAIIWFGFNETAIIFIVTLGGTLVMTINMRMGIKSVPPLYIKAASTMGASGIEMFWKIILPASVPYAVTGARLAWAFAWRALMAAELLSMGPGLGYTLKYAADFGQMSLVFGVIIIICVIGSVVDLVIFQRFEKNVIKRWGLES
ncbi:ABC transporter permease [Bacillus sp. LL01]|uniref:ABC transporter permease n=1 Tax=Bacillus sp. LL01 TaxID=1665556 RepID=UPI00064D0946|nr:ABC transporter permease [Bacillus sp. LL01]KMJ58200.1 ABC transporter permease [Bacillus sp. LL01]